MIRTLLFLVTLTFSLIGASGIARADDRPNIILCMADDQGWGDVGYYGHPVLQTPVLDEMAATALRFDRFYAAHPVCSPTRGSVMTGRNPNRFACFSWGRTLRPQEVTLAEVLQAGGYRTGHFGKWHLGSVRADDPVSPGGSGFDTWVSSPNFYENSPLMSEQGTVIETDGESSAITIQHALQFIHQCTDEDAPFLAVIWFGNPHTPHEALPELRALYPDCTPAEQNYYGEITGIDRSMGMLREALRDLDVADNTLLWYTSDNGAQGRSPGSTGGLRGAKGSVWEGGLRVPCIIEWPAVITTPRITALPCTTSDIYPTILDLLGVNVDGQPLLDGESIADLLRIEPTAREHGIGFWVFESGGNPSKSGELLQQMREEQLGNVPAATPGELTPECRMEVTFDLSDRRGHAAWLEGDWKLHRMNSQDGEPRFELYHLGNDPEESTNRLAEEPERLATMRAALDAWQNSVLRSLNGEDY